MATKITNKELNERVNTLEVKVNAIDEKLNRILDRIEGNVPQGKSSSKDTKKSTKKSPKATKCEVTIEDGQGRGQGKKFIKIIFDGKPTDKELKSLKDNGFKYFHPNKSWSTLHTEAKMKFAESLAK